MGSGTSSGRSVAAATSTPETATGGYMNRIRRLNTMDGLNDLVEEAANDDTLTNAEYQMIYGAALRKIQTGR